MGFWVGSSVGSDVSVAVGVSVVPSVVAAEGTGVNSPSGFPVACCVADVVGTAVFVPALTAGCVLLFSSFVDVAHPNTGTTMTKHNNKQTKDLLNLLIIPSP